MSAEELMDFCKDIANFKRPRHVLFIKVPYDCQW